jgi:hypothetical protein
LRHSNLDVTNHYLHRHRRPSVSPQDKLVDAILPSGTPSASKSHLTRQILQYRSVAQFDDDLQTNFV